MSPLDEYMELRKEAATQMLLPGFRRGAGTLMREFGHSAVSPQAVGEMGRAFGIGAVGAAGAAMFGGAVSGVRKLMGAASAKRDFRDMMDTHPDLHDVQQENPRFFNQAYKSLRRMNPTYAKDPMIAGSYMKKMMASPDTAGLTLAQSFRQPQEHGQQPLGLRVGKDSPVTFNV